MSSSTSEYDTHMGPVFVRVEGNRVMFAQTLHLAPDHTFMAEVMPYLTTKDMARWRQTARAGWHDIQTRMHACSMSWFGCVSRTMPVRQCQLCPAIRVFVHVEWCPYCERTVCVEHLQTRDEGHTVCCCQCAS